VYPLGSDASRWRGVNLGRQATDEWERVAALNNVPALSFCHLPISVSSRTDSICHFVLLQDIQAETAAPEPVVAGTKPGKSPSPVNQPENLTGVQRSAGSEGSAEAQRKASLREKISGGMKVVSGKLGHDKSKVEEGKKLMHGQSA